MTTTSSIFNIRIESMGKFFLALIITSFFAYCAFLVGTVQAVSERRSLSTEIREMKTTLAQLEIDYYARTHELGLGSLDTFGYTTTQPHFVRADGTSATTPAVALAE